MISRDKLGIALIHGPAWGLDCPPYGIAVLKAFLLSHGYKAAAYDLNLTLFQAAEPALKAQWSPDRYFFWLEPPLVEQALQRQLGPAVDRCIKTILDGGARVVGFSTLYSNQ